MIATPRLLLRQWRDSDREPFYKMSQDPAVMEFFPSLLGREESDALLDRASAGIAERGFGMWAVEIREPGGDQGAFAGFTGIQSPWLELPFCPCIEVGWRLARPFWGRGYATEGARAALDFGFTQLGLSEIVAFAVRSNARSIAVMQRLGMRFSEQFDYPRFSEGHPLRRHVLYRITAPRIASG